MRASFEAVNISLPTMLYITFGTWSVEVFADRIAVIGLVGQKLVRGWSCVEHDGQHLDVGCLPGREREDERSALAVAQGMDLSRSTTAGATNRLTLLPPFSAPAAERCALIWVLSARSCRCVRLSPVKAA